MEGKCGRKLITSWEVRTFSFSGELHAHLNRLMTYSNQGALCHSTRASVTLRAAVCY